MIYAKSKQENKDFFEVLDYYLQSIRQLHIRTYEYLWRDEGIYEPSCILRRWFLWWKIRNSRDKIKPLLKSATASFGITALNELQQLHNKKSIAEDGAFAIKTMEFINKKS